MAFRFKKFIVEDDRSTMRIGTDAMIMGAWANPGKAATILDIGTGCGVLALMMAQKSDAVIHAIDIHKNSVHQSSVNFSNSPWSERLTSFHSSFSDYVKTAGIRFDLIITNPPFFRNSLQSPSKKRNLARHGDDETLTSLIESVNQLLTEQGEFYIILPAGGVKFATDHASLVGLHVIERLNIRSKPEKQIHRVILRFGKSRTHEVVSNELVIRNADNSYSKDYISLTTDFHFGNESLRH